MKKLIIILFHILSIGAFGQGIQIVDKYCRNEPDTIDGSKIYSFVEKQPEFEGGMSGFYNRFRKEIHFPKQQKELQTNINLTFVIDTLGNVRNVCIFKPYFGDRLSILEKEVIKIIEKLNNWTPGQQDNKNVPVRMYLPMIIDWG